MAEIVEQPRKNHSSEQYEQTSGRRDSQRVTYALRSHRLTIATTVKRIQSHTFSDLIEAARMCCQNNPDVFSANQDVIITALALLHSGGNVQGEPRSETYA